MDSASVVLEGRLTAPPISKIVKGELVVTEFAMAINGLNDEVCFVDVAAFGDAFDRVLSPLDKGTPVCVFGRLRQSRWEKDGQKFSKHSVVATHVAVGLVQAKAKKVG